MKTDSGEENTVGSTDPLDVMSCHTPKRATMAMVRRSHLGTCDLAEVEVGRVTRLSGPGGDGIAAGPLRPGAATGPAVSSCSSIWTIWPPGGSVGGRGPPSPATGCKYNLLDIADPTTQVLAVGETGRSPPGLGRPASRAVILAGCLRQS